MIDPKLAADRLLVIVGPTASGKSALGLRLAFCLDGEIISADSMQVYRHFDIGTGKATVVERAQVRHHVIDLINPTETFSAARFVELADAAIAEVRSRNKFPIVVGGTGLYVRALLFGLFDAPPSSPAIRQGHQHVARERGVEFLFLQLVDVDQQAAAQIDPNDFVRISRALEVYQQTGRSISSLWAEHRFAARRYSTTLIAVDPGREETKLRIDARVEQMLARGWYEEVRALHEAGYGGTHPMGALGYRHLSAHLRGEIGFEEAVRQTKRDTRHFARRQRNWFNQEPGVISVASGDEVDVAWLCEH
jgi:tRNA dimethylallyltransferase